MRQVEIKEKLKKFLCDRGSLFSCDYEIFYFLIQARKIMEYQKSDATYRFLKFYIDWALHIIKDRDFNDKIKSIIKSAHSSLSSFKESYKNLEDLYLDLISLQNDVRTFLTENDLPIDLVDKNDLWGYFTRIYGEIVSEQPIRMPIETKTLVIHSKKEGDTISFGGKIEERIV